MTKEKSVSVNIQIDSGNAAFQEDARGEISRIICDIAGKIDNGHDDGDCRDINGNKVGQWFFGEQVDLESEDEEDAA